MKKFLSMMLVAVLLISVAAFAQASSPSRSASDLTSVRPSTSTSSTAADTTAPEVTIATVAATPEFTAVLDDIQAFISTGDGPVVNFFGDDVKAKLAALLPAGFDLESLTVTELVPMSLAGAATADGELKVEMEFATEFKPGDVVVPIAGVFGSDGEVTWIPLEGNVVTRGGKAVVEVTFPPEALAAIGDGSFVMGVLSEDEAAA